MSATFDTAPTAEQITAARQELAAVIARHQPGDGYTARCEGASRVAIELGVIAERLQACNEVDARLAARARALFEAWMGGRRDG